VLAYPASNASVQNSNLLFFVDTHRGLAEGTEINTNPARFTLCPQADILVDDGRAQVDFFSRKDPKSPRRTRRHTVQVGTDYTGLI
jgi:hypothetical protein